MIRLGLSGLKIVVLRSQRIKGLCLILFVGLILCFWQLGSTGLFDETPPKFAAAARGMSATGDWLTPRANGIPRFDKPPLIYWLMGLFYSLPVHEAWDPLGSWSARLPSALSSVWMMIVLADTVMRWPHKNETFPRRTAVVTSFAFALSPLVMVWSRVAVSDALLCSTMGTSMLFQWRCYVNPSRNSWIYAWIFLALAVLTKGPVAIVLMGMTLALFAGLQGDFVLFWKRLRPVPGLLITSFISLPWYLLELSHEGKPFWDSFFGYHNFQRFTSVVNSHQEPWWYFILILVVASLPFTPLLILGIWKTFKEVIKRDENINNKPEYSLLIYSLCWLTCIFLFFTFAGTKLPSYWLPATPAAAILIGSFESVSRHSPWRFNLLIAWIGSLAFLYFLSLFMWYLYFWGQVDILNYINDPEMPGFAQRFYDSGIILRAAICFTIGSLLGSLVLIRKNFGGLLSLELPMIILHLIAFLPLVDLVDKSRQLPLRQASELLLSSQRPNEALIMVGINKPSVHFYTNQVVLYESNKRRNLVNLTDRLAFEERQGWSGKIIQKKNLLDFLFKRNQRNSTALMIIDEYSIKLPHWRNLNSTTLGEFGIYKVWRIERISLERRAKELIDDGLTPNWKLPTPERF